MGYYDNVNPTLLEQVPPHARRLLELGCGAGAMARAVRERLSAQPYYVGIELDPQALERARDALDLAVPCNLDQVGNWSTAPYSRRWPKGTSTTSSSAMCWNICASPGKCCARP